MGGDGNFSKSFQALTGFDPMPWQEALYERFITEGEGNIPASCSLPTGLGKTLVIAIWLIALAKRPGKISRRLVYVVNRRTVVDQTTDEVEKLRRNLHEKSELKPLRDRLGSLAISTLRGQFADNREWSADPSRPAVICGTVDMIGSRLLFSGYGVGFKAKPLHAGFLGQDVLLVHDEAHLEPAFQNLLVAVQVEQKRCNEFARFHVMELTATTRNDSDQKATAVFSLTQEDRKHHVVKQRLEACKRLHLTEVADDKQVFDKIAKLAAGHKDANAAVLVFVRTLEAVATVETVLQKTERSVVLLTGTIRGKERDEIVEKPEFKRFLKGAASGETVYLVCTSAGEVGIDISADQMVCDLSTFDSMAQRFGRVNRYGDRTDTRIDVVHPASFGKIDNKTGEFKADEIDKRRSKTLDLLKVLKGDASPSALSKLDADERIAAFAPEPVILPVTEILFDAWALTSIRETMPGRPPVAPYLHGLAEWEPPRTSVAWREEVYYITGDLLERYKPQDLLNDYPLKPRELLSDTSERVFKSLELLANRSAADTPAWIISELGEVEVVNLTELFVRNKKRVIERIADCTILLPPSIGGLTKQGMLDGNSDHADDVADIESPATERRIRLRSNDSDANKKTVGMRLVQSIELSGDEGDDEGEPLTWDWYKYKSLEDTRTAQKPVLWDIHVGDVVRHTDNILAGLSLPEEITRAIRVAANLHDHGKRRSQFQFMLSNRAYPKLVLAKSGRKGVRLPELYRHEFGSLADAIEDAELQQLSPEMQDVVLHLIAAHHGRARPHFPSDEVFDPERSLSNAEAMAIETPRRFARLQRKYGRWGLAYLESLLRAADWAASAEPSAYVDEPEAKL